MYEKYDIYKDNFELMNRRLIVESEEGWREWIHNMPSLHFDRRWSVQVIPPFGGALARFYIDYKGKHVSVYFDAFGRLGWYSDVHGNQIPYFELYPYDDGDVRRYGVDETDKMMNDIRKILNGEHDGEVDECERHKQYKQ